MLRFTVLLSICVGAAACVLLAAEESDSSTAKPADRAAAARASSIPTLVQALSTQRGQLSYSLGLTVGANLRGTTGQYADIDPIMVAAGVRDAMSGNQPLLNGQQAQTALIALQKLVIANRNKVGEVNLRQAKVFLTDNTKQDGVKSTSSGLQYKIMRPGKGRSPVYSDKVSVHYTGTLLDGTVFDSSYQRGQPMLFTVGGVIRGWTEALQLMKVGGKWQLFIPPDLAYGANGSGSIPPNSALKFEVELLEIQDQ